VHACITGDARYHKVASSHRSRVNMMVCSTALINLARKMEERYGIPFFEGSFYGIEDTSIALRTIAKLLVERGAPADLLARTEALIASEEARAWRRISAYTPRLAGKRVLLYTGGVKSWSIVSALMEMGMVIVNTSTRKSTKEDKERIIQIMKDDAHMVDSIPPREMYASFARGDADVLLSGGRTQFVALKAKMPWVDINQERHHAFAGYDGMVELVRQLDLEVNSPLWQEVRRPAPWQLSAEDAAASSGP
jgi:nitrogenase molybdenum-cofactor synthesis protein NifE